MLSAENNISCDTAQSEPFLRPSFKNMVFLSAILMICTMCLYRNSMNGPLLFDDAPTLQCGIDGDWHTLRARRLCNWTFQWQFDHCDVQGFHLINIIIHGLVVVVLFNTLSLFTTAWFAFLLSLLFMVTPINVQAVSYITQRYASMVTMFGLSSFYFYLLWDRNKRNIGYAIGSILLYILAFNTKENAYILPAVFVLWQLLKMRKLNVPILVLSAIVLGGILYHVCGYFNFDRFFILRNREFTMYERMLTQPRVIWQYIHMVLYPIPQTLSISHHVDLSHHWYDPRTMLAFGGHILFIVWAWSNRKRNIFIPFGVIAFYIMMMPESSIINLELMFEHRMYFPLCFLLMAVACLPKSKVVPVILLIGLVSLPVNYYRQSIWQNYHRLWYDAARKAPMDARAQFNYATALISIGRPEEAMVLFKKIPSLPKWRNGAAHKMAELLLDDNGYTKCDDKMLYTALRNRRIIYVPPTLKSLQDVKRFPDRNKPILNPRLFVEQMEKERTQNKEEQE